MRIIESIKLDFDDVLFLPKRSTLTSRKDVKLERTYTFLNSKQVYTGVPIMAANMDTVGTIDSYTILKEHGLFTCFHKFIDKDDRLLETKLDTEYFAPSIGINDESSLIAFKDFKYLCLDVANGYTESFVNFVNVIRVKYPKVTIIAGNVATPEMTEELLLAGADIIKVGIGGGSLCLTRNKAGVGVPQLSAVIECADAAHGLGGHIISDGGCKIPADISKAFGAGADFVMLGGMLAGHDENSNFDEDGNALIYGMSSSAAMNTHYKGIEKHRTSEGRVVKTKSKGSLHDTVQDILGSVRSTCTYVGAKSLKELSKRTTFVRVNNTINKVYENKTVGE